ncbi:RNA-guided pseudouridylation complex pseudouridine synthase subunit Cbf5 [Candidatus Pacearchaeota archaeon]|nr:RNA-guided pseudouridylation complex pseudouridine synthase subunit Cbf5 [Candidatus Pacearchaeota archaeon]
MKSQKTIQELLEFGIINIDKPSGPTSFWVSQYVKNALGLSKTSHLGTLDPMVTGVLPVALNRACRLNEYLMHRDKTYIGIIRVHEEISLEDLQKLADSFIGKITQMPPVRSSVKRAERVREIKTFKILEKKRNDFLFSSQVQAGTYIRKLCDDLGKKITGAHMLELRRVQAGIFKEDTAITLYQFDELVEQYKKGNEEPLRKMIVSGEIVSTLLPVIKIRKDVVKKVLTGSPIFKSFLAEEPDKEIKEGDKVCVFAETRFMGCYNFINKDDLVAKSEFISN